MEDTAAAPLASQTPTIDKDAEIKALREQLEAVKKEQQEKAFNKSLEEKIEEIVASRIEERSNSERQRIEDARKMIEEAEANAALEEELLQNERYNKLTGYRENKIEEFKREITRLAQMGKKSKHFADLYKDYGSYLRRAEKGDERAKATLGQINMTYAAMTLGPDELVKIFKRNIGVDE